MNNILNKLYYGEINPSEKTAPATKRYDQINYTTQDEQTTTAGYVPAVVVLCASRLRT